MGRSSVDPLYHVLGSCEPHFSRTNLTPSQKSTSKPPSSPWNYESRFLVDTFFASRRSTKTFLKDSGLQGIGFNRNASAPARTKLSLISFADSPQMILLTPLDRIAVTVSVPSSDFSALATEIERREAMLIIF